MFHACHDRPTDWTTAMKVYLVYVNHDSTEMSGTKALEIIFLELEHAKHWAETQPAGWAGKTRTWREPIGDVYYYGNVAIMPMEVIEEDVAAVVLDSQREALRQETLSKLTSEERRALGFDN